MSANHVAVIGGLLGLLPFWGLAFASMLAQAEFATASINYLMNYAALILTFVGAIWWGIALSSPQKLIEPVLRSFMFGWSLVPCLLAWFLLSLVPQATLVGLACLLVFQLLLDFIFLWRAQLIAQWFWRLRIVLTLGAVPALLVATVQIW